MTRRRARCYVECIPTQPPPMTPATLPFLRHASALALAAALAGGCGELAYKRGGDAAALDAARQACGGGDPAAYERCMAARGWFVRPARRQDTRNADPVAEASVIPSDQRFENAAPPDRPAPAAAHTPDPLDRFRISSWWKAGGDAGQLERDTDACVARLGEVHRPDPATRRATRGLLLCMRDKGWTALRGT